MKHVEMLRGMHTCGEAVEYAAKFPTLQAAWDACERGEWMLWFAGKRSGDPWSAKRTKLVLAACECARLALKHTDDPRVLTCIETAEAWANGKATMEEVRAARYASAASAADAADAAAVARAHTLKLCADIVRKHYPEAPDEKA